MWRTYALFPRVCVVEKCMQQRSRRRDIVDYALSRKSREGPQYLSAIPIVYLGLKARHHFSLISFFDFFFLTDMDMLRWRPSGCWWHVRIVALANYGRTLAGTLLSLQVDGKRASITQWLILAVYSRICRVAFSRTARNGAALQSISVLQIAWNITSCKWMWHLVSATDKLRKWMPQQPIIISRAKNNYTWLFIQVDIRLLSAFDHCPKAINTNYTPSEQQSKVERVSLHVVSSR